MDVHPRIPFYSNLLLWSIPTLFLLYSLRHDIHELCLGYPAHSDAVVSICDVCDVPAPTPSPLPVPPPPHSPLNNEYVDVFAAVKESISSIRDRNKDNFVFV